MYAEILMYAKIFTLICVRIKIHAKFYAEISTLKFHAKILKLLFARSTLRWLKTVSSTFQEVDFDGSLLPLFIN